MSIEKERELFELWCVKDDEFCIHRYAGSDDYSDDYTQCAWLAWQASANRQGYKLVPIKCTNNMAYAAKEVDGRLSAFKYGDVWEAMIGACDD